MLWFVAFAVTGQVECDHSVSLSEVRNLIAPVIEIAAPAVNQDQRVFTFAPTLVMNASAVELRELRLTVRGECSACGGKHKSYD